MNKKKLKNLAAPIVLACALVGSGLEASAGPAPLKAVPAAESPIATRAPMLSAVWAGTRAVAVGANGVILLSDDQGATFRQAKHVPVSSTLTGVSFADDKKGWAVGQWGVILATSDGGETWSVQRLETDEDRPLFAVHFFDASHGVAVGLWSLVLVTDDGGKNWMVQHMEPPIGSKKADLNLLGLFADAKGLVYATAERGQVLQSGNRGRNWRYLDTGHKGSLWTGAALEDGVLLVGGQRGALLRSEDGGLSWKPVALNTKNSVTTVVARDRNVLVAGLDGLQAESKDGGRTFETTSRAGGESLTAALNSSSGNWVLLSRRGVVRESSVK